MREAAVEVLRVADDGVGSTSAAAVAAIKCFGVLAVKASSARVPQPGGPAHKVTSSAQHRRRSAVLEQQARDEGSGQHGGLVDAQERCLYSVCLCAGHAARLAARGFDGDVADFGEDAGQRGERHHRHRWRHPSMRNRQQHCAGKDHCSSQDARGAEDGGGAVAVDEGAGDRERGQPRHPFQREGQPRQRRRTGCRQDQPGIP
ncbi:hypothetical protein [Streptomyces noursei]|uniref:hypothetical protein n=1 Tax=Streptomyces noursei TaxID=1971 RepID=UPI0035AB8664